MFFGHIIFNSGDSSVGRASDCRIAEIRWSLVRFRVAGAIGQAHLPGMEDLRVTGDVKSQGGGMAGVVEAMGRVLGWEVWGK